MSDIEKLLNTADHTLMQLEKANSVLNEISAYFFREDEHKYLPVAASHINTLLFVLGDYIRDATGAAKSTVKKAQKILESE